MTVKSLLKEAKKLSPDKREILAHEIIVSVVEDAPLPEEIKAELDRRWAEHKKHPDVGYTWDELKKKLGRIRRKKHA